MLQTSSMYTQHSRTQCLDFEHPFSDSCTIVKKCGAQGDWAWRRWTAASAEAGRQLFRGLASRDRAWPWKLQESHADWIAQVRTEGVAAVTLTHPLLLINFVSIRVLSFQKCSPQIVTSVHCLGRYIQRTTRRAELTDPAPEKLSTLQVGAIW